MIDCNGKEIKVFTVGNGRFFINNIIVSMSEYLEEKAKYEGRIYVIIEARNV